MSAKRQLSAGAEEEEQQGENERHPQSVNSWENYQTDQNDQRNQSNHTTHKPKDKMYRYLVPGKRSHPKRYLSAGAEEEIHQGRDEGRVQPVHRWEVGGEGITKIVKMTQTAKHDPNRKNDLSSKTEQKTKTTKINQTATISKASPQATAGCRYPRGGKSREG